MKNLKIYFSKVNIMRIVGFNLKKILVERKKAFRGGVKINTLMNIIGIKKEDIKIVSGKDVLSFYETLYETKREENDQNVVHDLDISVKK